MSLTQSFLCERVMTLVVGLHLLLSSVDTVVKPAYPFFCSSTKSDSGEESRCSQQNHKSTSRSGLWKNISCNLCIVHFNEIVGLSSTCNEPKVVQRQLCQTSLNVSWIVHVKGTTKKSRIPSASGMCRRGQVRKPQRLRVRHGVPDVKMVVLSRHKHSLLT